MDSATQRITPLRRRMIDDMRMRKLSDKTQHHYIRAVRQFAGFLGRSPDTASVEDLRRYQLHLVDHGVSPISLNAAIKTHPAVSSLGACPTPARELRRVIAHLPLRAGIRQP